TSTEAIQKLCDSLTASALFVHTNPLQEALQPEGTPQFKRGIEALQRLCSELSIPVILKEVGCGFSENTLRRLVGKGLAAVDISGKGGTHWGRVEGYGTDSSSPHYKAAEVFAHWGVPTVDALLAVQGADLDYELWASGGVRSGLDAAKLIALGANMVGAAKPFLEGAMAGPKILQKQMDQFDLELKIALFSTGSQNPEALQEKQQWRKI
ncbi:MAG: alpha-hydroxy-acid oxidizing protein, partial [Methylococcales bacterium]|nr:alpha-hydroxy-acid oxidizing protein [Methylococcales bacterium]